MSSSPHNLSKLAPLMSEDPGVADWSSAELEAIWTHQLNSTLDDARRDLPTIANLLPMADLSRGMTFGQVLTSQAPHRDLLAFIKAFSKANLQQRLLPSDICSALYYLSIALTPPAERAAFTTTPPAEIEVGLRWLASRPWLDEATRQALRR